ncbi:NAD-dependent epimerase/dehydratase family protein [Tessaracoccus rhinocerotis]|uniref:NAD-dependent epimerase/dehydratase family protein n=1 Tax=Tessaracoccus rhinocerotis TaxID=1689449 RepID=A0A553K638_9ACTN|nr:NAD-dependent epimerase/dehydratase family protein [Tessaracoccus rhinocerotis]TRY20178.1 NAD-dependent epimerase/dehydratase family protein [Tessaracoccus rhinocerotis]
MRVVVIGGSGHIGSFLVPRLVRLGHQVVNISRGQRASYVEDPAWQEVEHVTADRIAEDADGTFPSRVARLEPDAVVDLIGFTVESEKALVDALRGRTGHLLYCGSTWRHGPSQRVPIREDDPTPALGDYGAAKAATAAMLKAETASGGLDATSLHPGHIVGPGWHPIGPLGNADPSVWWKLSAGEPLPIPGIGTDFMHHVHADDVAQGFELALTNREAAAGEDFNLVAPSALNVRGYATVAASWFGRSADLRSVTWDEFRRTTSQEFHDSSWNHLVRDHYFSIDKARTMLGYNPGHEPEAAILEAVRWLIENDRLHVATPLTV